MTTAIEKAYERIKSGILAGEYKPGDQVKEDEVARSMGVSRTPVSKAIQRLAQEGFVITRPNRRSYVVEVTLEKLEQVFDVLSFLEGKCAQLAATRISDEMLNQLRELNDEMAQVDRNTTDDKDRFLSLNRAFHYVIYEAADNEKITQLTAQLIEYTRFLFYKHGEISLNQAREAIDQHQEIIDAMAQRDADLAKLTAVMHTESVRRSVRALWDQLESNHHQPVKFAHVR